VFVHKWKTSHLFTKITWMQLKTKYIKILTKIDTLYTFITVKFENFNTIWSDIGPANVQCCIKHNWIFVAAFAVVKVAFIENNIILTSVLIVKSIELEIPNSSFCKLVLSNCEWTAREIMNDVKNFYSNLNKIVTDFGTNNINAAQMSC